MVSSAKGNVPQCGSQSKNGSFQLLPRGVEDPDCLITRSERHTKSYCRRLKTLKKVNSREDYPNLLRHRAYCASQNLHLLGNHCALLGNSRALFASRLCRRRRPVHPVCFITSKSSNSRKRTRRCISLNVQHHREPRMKLGYRQT